MSHTCALPCIYFTHICIQDTNTTNIMHTSHGNNTIEQWLLFIIKFYLRVAKSMRLHKDFLCDYK